MRVTDRRRSFHPLILLSKKASIKKHQLSPTPPPITIASIATRGHNIPRTTYTVRPVSRLRFSRGEIPDTGGLALGDMSAIRHGFIRYQEKNEMAVSRFTVLQPHNNKKNKRSTIFLCLVAYSYDESEICTPTSQCTNNNSIS